jgi:hypothetical protein
MPSLFIQGHHGLGDCIHQRAIVRHFLDSGYDVWIETPWPSVYHDLPVHCVPKDSPLRTQAKNLARERALFSTVPVPRAARRVQLRYDGDGVRRAGSVLGAMGYPDATNFWMPVPWTWWARAAWGELKRAGWNGRKPIMLYRPLVERIEYRAGALRNPDPAAYAGLFNSIRDRYFVVSVADIEPNREWIVGERIEADVTFHHGELNFPTLAGLAYISDLVFCAPGFATILAQAVETPSVTVYGGFERGTSFSTGARHAPTLAIEPVQPCDCFDGGCRKRCTKAIDMPAARAALEAFIL